MPESNKHRELVINIKKFLSRGMNFEEKLIKIDVGNHDERPERIDGHIPDASYEWRGTLIIGEAKIAGDIDSDHSVGQYESFLEYCERYEGEAIFILSIPFESKPAAINRINKIRNKMRISQTKIRYLTELDFIGDSYAEN